MKSFIVDKLFIAQARKAHTFTYRVEYGYQTLTVGQYARDHVLINETSFKENISDFKTDHSPKIIFAEMYCDIGGWQALTKLLRVGDKLNFRAMENGCEAMRKHDIHVDMLFATIYRNGKNFVQDIPVSMNYSTIDTLRSIR